MHQPADRHHHRPAQALHDAEQDEIGQAVSEAASAEPSVNTTIAARKTVRAPKRSAIQPLNGMNTASDRR